MSSLLLLASLGQAQEPQDISRLIKSRWKEITATSTWRSPTVQEREDFRDGLQQLISASVDCQETALAQAESKIVTAGFQVERLTVDEVSLLVVSEAADQRRGGGLYAIRCGPSTPLVIQAPHAFFDQRTGVLARQLFVETGARMGAWNTVHRYRSHPDEQRQDTVHPADVAHEPGSFYQAATVAAAMGDSALRFVQLHGYSDGRVSQDAILSSGNPTQPPRLLADNLGDVLGTVALFGVHTQKLGGVSNAQGRFLASWPEGRFLHLELSATVRAALVKDASRRAQLAAALQESWQ